MVDKKGSFNIWKIIKGDFDKIRNNTIAWIVIIGLTIVPSLYAWFNIAASWDPYSNTGNLKVAVASEDIGYEGDLTSMNLNIGDKVLSSLRENDALNWVFTSKEDAIQGVKDGSYYAALVIPKSFSRDMMSFFTPDVHRSELIYFLNEKENAIAPKITDKGASAVKNQIDAVFARSITEIVLEIASGLSSLLEKGDADKYMNAFLHNFEAAGAETSQNAEILETYALLTDSLADIAVTATELAGDMTQNAGNTQQLLAEASGRVSETAAELEKIGREIMRALDKAADAYDSIAADLDKIINAADAGADEVVSKLEKIEKKLDKMTQGLEKLRSTAENLYDQIPEDYTELRSAAKKLIADLDDVISRQNDAAKAISTAISEIQKVQKTVKEVRAVCIELRKDIDVIRTKYVTEIEPAIEELSASLIETNGAVSEVFDNMDVLAADLETDGRAAGESLRRTSEAIRTAAEEMKTVGGNMQQSAKKLAEAIHSGEAEKIRSLLGASASELSEFVSAPVVLDKKVMFPVANYGSAMAPFYTVLSIWVGAIVLAAMLKVNLTEERKRELEDLRDYQVYLGRMVFFIVIALLQSGLVCLGDLFFLEIQCEHPGLFLLAGWFTGVVFTVIMYTLPISFGDVGKAIAVILLVIQVAGSGGTFPIEMTPQFFQNMAGLMPFTYSMSAMRECIGGLYGNTYWISLGYLAVYAAAFLILGIVLRKPIIRLNEMFSEKLESTKLM